MTEKLESNDIINTNFVIIGSGPGGFSLAIELAKAGKKVTIIEKDKLGGICLNEGCIPTKALRYATSKYQSLSEMKNYGINISNYSVNIDSMNKWKNKILKKLNLSLRHRLSGLGINIVNGNAQFKDSKTIIVDDLITINFKKAIIATGSTPIKIPSLITSDRGNICYSTRMLQLKDIPSLCIIGGGYIGIEIAQSYANLGCKVTIIEQMKNILPAFDPEMVEIMKHKLSKIGVSFILNSSVISIDDNLKNVKVKFKDNNYNIERTLKFSKIMMSIGRKPNTRNLNLENAKIEVDNKGFIGIDNEFRTSSPGGNIFAIGDCSSHTMLAHVATDQAIKLSNTLLRKKETNEEQLVPFVIYTTPEICTIGITQQEAKKQKLKITVTKAPIMVSGKAKITGDNEGFCKIIYDKKSKVIIGSEMMFNGASEILSIVTVAIRNKMTADEFSKIIFPHPTVSEAVMETNLIAISKGLFID